MLVADFCGGCSAVFEVVCLLACKSRRDFGPSGFHVLNFFLVPWALSVPGLVCALAVRAFCFFAGAVPCLVLMRALSAYCFLFACFRFVSKGIAIEALLDSALWDVSLDRIMCFICDHSVVVVSLVYDHGIVDAFVGFLGGL